MATNIFVDWSDGLEGRVFDNHSRNGGQGICQQKLPGGGGGDARGWIWEDWCIILYHLLLVKVFLTYLCWNTVITCAKY